MRRSVLPGLIAVALAAVSSTALAEAPNIQTPAPVIFLADNLDEADTLGWCIDTVGRGLSDKLHAHSCKPRGGDVQFQFDGETGQIRSVAFEGLCAVIVVSDNTSANLGLVECNSSSNQSFAYDEPTMSFRPVEDPSKCLTVGEQSRSAGPFMSRDLLIKDCSAADVLLQNWVIRP